MTVHELHSAEEAKEVSAKTEADAEKAEENAE